jgi:hypothetical protein
MIPLISITGFCVLIIVIIILAILQYNKGKSEKFNKRDY